MRKIKVIISDDEMFICTMLKNIIEFDALGLELADVTTDGEQLYQSILQNSPDIVITDISMPVMDGLEVIRRCREKDIACRFIVISGYRQFEYSYNALKYNVSDYILKPVNAEELNKLLAKVTDEIKSEDGIQILKKMEESVQNYCLSPQLLAGDMLKEPLTVVNANLNRHFVPGNFSVFILKLDDLREQHCDQEELTSAVSKLKIQCRETLMEQCEDMVIRTEHDLIIALLNYKAQKEGIICQSMRELFEKGLEFTSIFQGLHITMCIGEPVKELSQIAEAVRQSRTALFARMFLGTQRQIFFNEISEKSVRRDQIKQYADNAIIAVRTLSVQAFMEAVDHICRLPQKSLCAEEIVFLSEDVTDALMQCWESAGGEEAVKQHFYENDLQRLVNSCTDLDTYFQTFKQKTCAQMNMIVEEIDRKNLLPIRKAYDYVEEHYGEPIKLDDVAEIVNLSPGYFSMLFSKKTGQTFSDYVTDYRIKKACEFLSGSSMNVNEIAYALSFTDSRSFSKLFKRKMGIKPTQYRKIYQ